MDSWLVFRRNRVILNQWTKRNDCSIKRFSKMQQYGRGAFFHSAHCSVSSPISVRSVWCRRTMIPGKIFTKLCRIPRNCQCKWFQASNSAPRTFASSFAFHEKFLFCTDTTGSIGRPRSCTNDCISMIVSRFTTITENFLICCNKLFCTKYDSANASSARRPCNFGPLTDIVMSVFREVSINTVFTTNPHFSKA